MVFSLERTSFYCSLHYLFTLLYFIWVHQFSYFCQEYVILCSCLVITSCSAILCIDVRVGCVSSSHLCQKISSFDKYSSLYSLERHLVSRALLSAIKWTKGTAQYMAVITPKKNKPKKQKHTHRKTNQQTNKHYNDILWTNNI